MVKSVVAIDRPRVRFPADAFFLSIPTRFFLLRFILLRLILPDLRYCHCRLPCTISVPKPRNRGLVVLAVELEAHCKVVHLGVGNLGHS